jgi:hypothetical protein
MLFTMHSDEALLAIVFILIIHFYMEHLRSCLPHELDMADRQMRSGEAPPSGEYDYLFGKIQRRKEEVAMNAVHRRTETKETGGGRWGQCVLNWI